MLSLGEIVKVKLEIALGNEYLFQIVSLFLFHARSWKFVFLFASRVAVHTNLLPLYIVLTIFVIVHVLQNSGE